MLYDLNIFITNTRIIHSTPKFKNVKSEINFLFN